MSTKTTLPALSEAFKKDSCYYGERGDWPIAYSTHRDADTLNRSNWAVLLKRLGGESETVAIEEASHWAVGWVQRIVIHPQAADKIAIAEAAKNEIETYPILDETHFSELESAEANRIWKNCYQLKDRIEYVRKFRSQFEFRDFGDLLGCIRGEYFAGYASELIG